MPWMIYITRANAQAPVLQIASLGNAGLEPTVNYSRPGNHMPRRNFVRLLVCAVTAICLHTSLPAMAEDAYSKATSAVTSIIFDFGAEEFVSYGVRDNGYVDVTFARNTPDGIYNAMLEKFRSHPDIHGVMAGRGGPTCTTF